MAPRPYPPLDEPQRASGESEETHYLLSGILFCDECKSPLTIYGGVTRYYRCNTHFGKGTCENELRVREEVIRADCLDAIREQIQTPQAIEYVRRKSGELLGNYTRELDRDLKERRDRLQRTEDRIKELVGFIADGDRSEYVVSALRDLEAQAKAERAAIERLQREAQEPLRLPSLEEITCGAFSLEKLIAGNTDQARLRIRRFLKDGEIRVIRPRAATRFEARSFPSRWPLQMKMPKLVSNLGIFTITCKVM